MRRSLVGMIVVAAVGFGTIVGVGLAALAPAQPVASRGPSGAVIGASAVPPPSPTATPEPARTPRPTPAPARTPAPTPAPVAAPLTGRLVTADVAARRVLAVMVDDHSNARPQSGFNDASIVWHAPAEGGIARYMLLFQERPPAIVGPVRSARQYYIAWAAEWRSLYVHSGGSPQALATLRQDGQGELVYDADEFRWGGRYLWRSTDRFAPHNVYTDGEQLRRLAARVGAKDGPIEGAWRFAADVALARRPVGGRIDVPYLANKVSYRYERASNRYVRSVTGASPQIDRADGKVVAPKNVVVLFMSFRPLDDGNPDKKRQEADYIGTGKALIATNGQTVEGTWRKETTTGPTLLFSAAGQPVVLTVGQTFVQVVDLGTEVTVVAGKPVPREPDAYPEGG